MMRINERYDEEKLNAEIETRGIHANSIDSYAEDSQFMRHLRTLDTRHLTPEEVRRLIRIAEKGMSVRFGVEKWLADIKRSEAEKIADKSINNGLKYSEIYRRLSSRLRGMR
ncbi:Hypothetical protein TFLO_2889 [Trichococcus flocculiformis]|uniref:Uncharacterized protein n=1 Tax=Trichococcus flocculiformis TaxID=82803 RepID=A0AB38BLB1_9LACT|nr:hypothetical protein [Trichococcus flocculiformis]CZR04009.1 Hypothetical protein TFLO_2889 [Trichococcus flocculiformis]SFI16855.1 hypothetical protein SAMN04488507_106421 [Trichococcus flocculiformis]